MTDHGIEELLRTFVESPDNPCFVCGQTNPHGLHLKFELHGGMVRSSYIPAAWNEGWHNVVHGGILAAVLDEAMAYTLFFRGILGLTAKMELRFRSPARPGDILEVEAGIVHESRRLIDVDAHIRRGTMVIADGAARFIKRETLDVTDMDAARHRFREWLQGKH